MTTPLNFYLGVYERKRRPPVLSEGNSIMERVQIPDTPAKNNQRRHSRGISVPSGSTSSLLENKENPVADLPVLENCSGLMDTNLGSVGSLDLNKPVLETEGFADSFEFSGGFTAALLETDDLAREDDEVLTCNLPSSQSSSNPENQGFNSIEGSFIPVVQPTHATESMSQYNLKNQELVDCGKYNVADTNYIGSLKRKLQAARPQRPQKRLKRPKKKVYRPKVVRNLGRPIPRMEPKTPTKKNKRLKLKKPKTSCSSKKSVSLKKSSSTISLNSVTVPLDFEHIVSEREISIIDTADKHSKEETSIKSGKPVEDCITECVEFSVALYFSKKKKRTTLGKKWEVKDYSRIMEPNFQKIKKKRRMGRKRYEVDKWQVIASRFRKNYLKLRQTKRRRAAPEINKKEVHNIYDTEKQLCPCFITDSEELHIEESLFSMISLLESDNFELISKSIDTLEDDINVVVQKHARKSNHGMLVCHDEHGPLVELGMVASAKGELGMVVKTKGKGKRQEKLDKIEHGELAFPWKLELQNEVLEGDKHDKKSEFWKKERQFFRGRINLFLSRMNIVLGNRKFSAWDGSVMDSIIGVFLTQNVSDHLSSSAFISLAAAFPCQFTCNQELTYAKSNSSCEQSRIVKIEELVGGGISKSNCERSNGQTHCEHNIGSQESVGSNMVLDEELFTQEATTTMECGNQKSSDGKVDDFEMMLCSMSDSFKDHGSSTPVNSYASTDTSSLSLTTQVGVQNNFEDLNYYVDMPKSDSWIDTMIQNSQICFYEEKRGKKAKASARETKNEGAIVNEKPDWDYYKRTFGKRRGISHMDSIDWEAVRQADVSEIAEAIKTRGQHNVIAERIKKFLNEVKQDHKEIDLEWLRWAPDALVQKYLSQIEGIGLKSVECVRLLALKQTAFPVDVNVGRIAIRLGWVSMQPLPVDVQIHLLEEMPVMNNIQKYLWPRLWNLGFKELYELHYQMITFGKVYCTKRDPKCHTCPMKNECKYYLSAYASAKHAALPGATKKQGQTKVDMVISSAPLSSGNEALNPTSQSCFEDIAKFGYQMKNCEPIIEEPASPGPSSPEPASPSPEYVERDIEDLFLDNPSKKSFPNSASYKTAFQESDVSAIIPFLTPEEATSIPVRKLKEVNRLMTKHLVYIIDEKGPLFKELQLERRHPYDTCPYLFALCTSDQIANVSQSPQKTCSCEEFKESSCNGEKICLSCDNLPKQASDTDIVQGTVLIPCRTAMRGSFPLNGTYFQVNEVFADHESSINPINVRREWLWDLTITNAYFGTSTSKILSGLSTFAVAMCFKEGFICVRAFNRQTRRPEPLLERFHISTVIAAKKRKKKEERQKDD